MSSFLIKAGAGAAAIISIVGVATIIGVPTPATEDDVAEHRQAAEKAMTNLAQLTVPEAMKAASEEWWMLNREANAREKELEADPNATQQDWENLAATRARVQVLAERYNRLMEINEQGVYINGQKE